MGVTVRPAETRLTERAVAFLAAGPAPAVTLIEYVCDIPGAPAAVAEQMAIALFAAHPGFRRDTAGRWHFAPEPVAAHAAEATYVAGAPVAPDAMAPLEAKDALDALSYAVVDVETTGTRAGAGDRITEIAAVVVRDGIIADRFESLINPERAIPPYITALTHISQEMVADAPRFADVWPALLDVIGDRVFVAHNATFDWRFVGMEAARASLGRLGGRRLCTVRLARRLLPHLPSRRLGALAQHYGIEIAARHRAAGDAEATAIILLRLLAAARERDCATWNDLETLLGARSRGRRRSALPRPVDCETTA